MLNLGEQRGCRDPFVGGSTLESPLDLSIFSGEEGKGRHPRVVRHIIPALHCFFFKELTSVHVGNEKGDFFLVSVTDAEFFAVRLASIQLSAESGGMGIWSGAPGCMESSFDVDFLLVGDFDPCAEVDEEEGGGLVF